MNRALLTLVIAVGLPATASAQAKAPSELRPDTMGANFDHTAPGKSSAEAFDFLVGTWSFSFQNRQGAGFGTVIPGIWTASKTHDGRMVEDTWQLGATTDPTISWRAYNPARQLWEMQGLKFSRGSWDPGTAWGSGSERFVVQSFAGTTLGRMRYYGITQDRFAWRADVSTDGGKTWLRDAWILNAERTKK